MINRQKWMNRRLALGRILMIAGVVVILVGLALPRLAPDLSFNPRLIVGLGIVLLSAGFALQVQYWGLRREPKAVERWMNEETDERSKLIRNQAGYAAFWACLGMTYALLMWLSFSSNGSLPKISEDLLWYCLAAIVVVSFGVYAAGIIRGNQRS